MGLAGAHAPVPSQAMAIHGAMLAKQLANSVANGLRYHVQLRADQAADRLARTDGRYHPPVRLQRYLNELRHPLSSASAAARSKATTSVGPAATGLEKLRAHVQATNSSEIGLMMRCDPVSRAVAAAVVVVAGTAVTVAAVTEEATAYSAWRWVGWQGATIRFGSNAIGQGVGNYATSGDAKLSFYRINWFSSILSAGGVPMMTSAIGSAAFKFDLERFSS